MVCARWYMQRQTHHMALRRIEHAWGGIIMPSRRCIDLSRGGRMELLVGTERVADWHRGFGGCGLLGTIDDGVRGPYTGRLKGVSAGPNRVDAQLTNAPGTTPAWENFFNACLSPLELYLRDMRR